MSKQAPVKVAIVTGGSSGIGQSAAIRIAQRGAGVIVTFKKNPDGAHETVAEIEKAGGSAVALQLDVGRTETFPGFVEQAANEIRRVWNRTTFDFLVNNAGVGGGMPFGDVTDAYFDAMFAANFKGPFFLTQKLLPLIAEGGHIVNVSSGSARQVVSVGYSVYGSAKAALTTVTRYWAKELAPRKIRVNSISPGPVLTNIADGAFAKHPEYVAPLAANTLLGRIAQPDDVGDVIAALLSDSCRYVTATDLDVSGGFMV